MEGNIVGLKRCQGGGQRGDAIGMAISEPFPTLAILPALELLNAPKLQMYDALNANLRHIIVVKERVSNSRDTQ